MFHGATFGISMENTSNAYLGRFCKKGEATEIQARPFSPKSYSEELYDMKGDPDSVINLMMTRNIQR